jgi:hypothetical protein
MVVTTRFPPPPPIFSIVENTQHEIYHLHHFFLFFGGPRALHTLGKCWPTEPCLLSLFIYSLKASVSLYQMAQTGAESTCVQVCGKTRRWHWSRVAQITFMPFQILKSQGSAFSPAPGKTERLGFKLVSSLSAQ